MKVDLEQFHREWTFDRRVAPTIGELVAELRAAREVIEEADSYRAFLPLTVVEKLDDYDQAVTS